MADPNAESADARSGDDRPDDLREEMSEEQERARALAAVLRDQAERAEAARDADTRRLKHTRIRRGVLVAAWVGMAYIWLGAPSWVRVAPPPTPTILDEARALRVDVFLQSQKIEAYRQVRGRLPYVLSQAGPPFPGMQYRRKDSRFYELFGKSDRVRLKYDSEIAPLDFVGSAANILDDRQPRIRR
jgi:hypothetical protein